MNPLLELLEHGQSYWLDNLTRGMIRDGTLERRVREEGLRGVTSNPAIFSKAISRGSEYDDQIESLAREGRGIEEIYEEIVVSDIREACDVLRPVYDDPDGTDGFATLEVSPHLAHDTEGSIEEGRRLFRAVDRPNVLIKIPGTPAGVPAIEELLYEGVNVNVTLLFSVEAYDAVAHAFLRALERRLEDDLPIERTASVASFFLSRIDVLVDRLLAHRIRPRSDAGGSAPVEADGAPAPEELLGEVAIANARLAYDRFRRIFDGERWERLAAAGAHPQRMLWASTSTKNPLYSDVRYVEPLIGPHTVNTLPERTIEAFADHGTVETTVEEDLDEAREIMSGLERSGIDFEGVTEELLHEGVQKFVAPYDDLMSTLDAKRRDLMGSRSEGRFVLEAAELGDDLEDALDALSARKYGRRLAAGDPGPWVRDGVDPDAIRERLGWVDAGTRFRDRLASLAELVDAIRDEGCSHVVLLGTGGSVRAAEAFWRILGPAAGHPELVVLDDTHPEAVRRVESSLDLDRTLFVVASKSGTTVETTSLYRYFRERVDRHGSAGDEDTGRRFVAVTDEGSPLAEEAEEAGFRRTFVNPSDIGGRYSALSWFGLVPAALAGVDVDLLLGSAAETRRRCDPALPASRNPAIRLGVLLGLAARAGRDKLTVLADEPLEPLLPWLEQLVAESTGKAGRGLVPVRGERSGDADARGDDRIFVHLQLEAASDGEAARRLDELGARGHPVVQVTLPDRHHLGGEIFRWEVAVATAALVLDVNPFDEPDVTATKREVEGLLAAWEEDGVLDEGPVAALGGGMACHLPGAWLELDGPTTPDRLLRRALGTLEDTGYVALLPFFPPSPDRREALERLGTRLGELAQRPVTVDHGPAYLHATGQLHKGGPPGGLYVVITGTHGPEDPPVPGRTYGLSTLHRAQALADVRVLARRGRRVLRLHVDGEPAEALDRLRETLGTERPAPAAAPA
jgi:transaldolase/glucose-6-phosphate isomerase